MLNIIEQNLENFSTIKTFSKAKYFIKINSLAELNELSTIAKFKNLKIIIIGNGTNILFSKTFYDDSIIIKLGKSFNYITINTDTVEIGAAFPFIRAGKKLISLGYSNFLYMSLIPGSTGGGICQNAGTTNDGEVKDSFLYANIYDLHECKTILLSKDDMSFAYRNSILKSEPNRYIILSAVFSLGRQVAEKKELEIIAQDKINKKREKEPTGNSFGSTFKSLIHEKQVWWYLDNAGLRGKVIGGAKFSEKHPNWIINFDNANAEDILALIQLAKKEVKEHFNIHLEEEVVLI